VAGFKFLGKHELANSTTSYVRFTGLTTTSYSWLRIFFSGRGAASANAPSRLRIGINNDYVNMSGGTNWYMGRNIGGYNLNSYTGNEFSSTDSVGFPQDGSNYTYNSSSNTAHACWAIDMPLPKQAAEGGQLTYMTIGAVGGYAQNCNGASGMGSNTGLVNQSAYRWSTSYSSDMLTVTKLSFDIDNSNWRQGSSIYLYGFEE